MKLDQVRLEAIGARGEACVIVRTGGLPRRAGERANPQEEEVFAFRLATGERLQATASPGVFETLDGQRRFTLRNPGERVSADEAVAPTASPLGAAST